jgi:hypothetical protein
VERHDADGQDETKSIKAATARGHAAGDGLSKAWHNERGTPQPLIRAAEKPSLFGTVEPLPAPCLSMSC